MSRPSLGCSSECQFCQLSASGTFLGLLVCYTAAFITVRNACFRLIHSVRPCASLRASLAGLSETVLHRHSARVEQFSSSVYVLYFRTVFFCRCAILPPLHYAVYPSTFVYSLLGTSSQCIQRTLCLYSSISSHYKSCLTLDQDYLVLRPRLARMSVCRSFSSLCQRASSSIDSRSTRPLSSSSTTLAFDVPSSLARLIALLV